MSQKSTYFPPTTPQQRKLLFEIWKAIGNVTEACREAHVGRGTFYYWKPRFEAEGYEGLEAYQRKGPEKIGEITGNHTTYSDIHPFFMILFQPGVGYCYN
jgi:hypothetical protein